MVINNVIFSFYKDFDVTEENINTLSNFKELVESLNSIAEIYQLPIIVSTHPRTRKMIDENMLELNPLVQLLKPLGFNDYIKLQIKYL